LPGRRSPGQAKYSAKRFGLQIDITYTYNLPAINPQVINGRQTLSNAAIDSPERRRLPLLLRRAWYGLNRAFRRRIAHLGLTPDQFTVMRTLLENEGLTQRELVAAMTSDANTVAALIERMEAACLVQRRPHEKDRRARRLRLTKTGRTRYHSARSVALAMQAEVLSALPEKAREPFLEELESVAEACRLAAERSPKTKVPPRQPD